VSGDSLLHIENVQIDDTKSWLLCNLQDRARLETKDSSAFPNEIYPHANSMVRSGYCNLYNRGYTAERTAEMALALEPTTLEARTRKR
jgi:hypothetical protein